MAKFFSAIVARLGVRPRPKLKASIAGCSFSRTIAGPEVQIHSVELAHTLMVKHKARRYGPVVSFLRHALGHEVMIVADGEAWRQTHDALMPAFTPATVLARYTPVIRQLADDTFQALAKHAAGANPENGTIEVAIEPVIRTLIARVMGFAVFGRPFAADEAVDFQALLDAATRPVDAGLSARINMAGAVVFRRLGLSGRQPFVFPRAQRKIIRQLWAWVGAHIDEARTQEGVAPVLERLDRRYQALGPKRRRRCMVAECLMLFVAGIDTTAAGITFALARLAGDRDACDAVTSEARQGGAAQPAKPGVAHKYPAIFRVLQETLRRHTIVPTMLREAATDCPVGQDKDGAGVIRRGDTLRFLTVQGHMRGRIWPRPKTFDPARFLGLSQEQRANYIPFGMGPQSCIGRALAETESVLVLQSLLRFLDLHHAEDAGPIAVERNAIFTNRPMGVAIRVAPASWGDAAPA
jgi:cytochrome P450